MARRTDKSAEDRIREVEAQFTEDYLEEQREDFENELHDAAVGVESPIEQLMIKALIYAIRSVSWHGDIGNKNKFVFGAQPTSLENVLAMPVASHGVYIWPQVSVGKYRADFVARYADWRGGFAMGAIECDGHDHHNLTKEQASHDRERDRYFQHIGLLILRYPGSDIWRAPLKCATDALNILEKCAARPDSKRWKDG